MDIPHDDVVLARAALIALRQTVPEALRPKSPLFVFLPGFDTFQEDDAAQRLAKLAKPALCFAALAMDSLAIATWPMTDVPTEADVRWLFQPLPTKHSLHIRCAAPPGVTSETQLTQQQAQRLFAEYVIISRSGASLSDPSPDTVSQELTQELYFSPQRPGPVGWVYLDESDDES